jgi:hypothetical protein
MEQNPTTEEFEQFLNNKFQSQQEISDALANNKSMIVQSNAGMGKNHLIKKAADIKGLKLAEFDLATQFREPADLVVTDVSFGVKKLTKEAAILTEMEKNNAKAILLDMAPGDDVTAFMNVAKDLKVPLIASITRTELNNTNLDVITFDSIDGMQPIFDALKPVDTVLSDKVLDRMKMLRVNNEDSENSNKPKLK